MKNSVVAGSKPAQSPGHDLEAVADAQHRHPGVEDGRVHAGGALGVDRRRAAGEDDGGGAGGEHVLRRHGVRDDLGVDAGFAHAAGDELGVLGAEVDDEDRAGGPALTRFGGGTGRGGRHAPRIAAPARPSARDTTITLLSVHGGDALHTYIQSEGITQDFEMV